MEMKSICEWCIELIIMLCMFVQFSHGLIEIQSDKEKPVKTVDVQGVEGNRVSLPCPLAGPSRDKVYMVLWFRDDVGIPLYSFDVRGVSLSKGRHWSSPAIFGPRAKFNANSDPATLDIDDIKRHDQGVYRCRVDFRSSQTQSFRYNLSIIILPERPVVLNRWGLQLNGTTLGPLEERDDIILVCRVVGGRPQPAVRWLVNGILVDDQYEQNSGDVIENRLLWPGVQRTDLNSVFTCQAVNTKLVEAKERSFVLDLLLKPLSVKIVEPASSLVADRRYEVLCETTGSRPNAIITFYKGKRPLRRTKDESKNGTTISELSFVPSVEDDGKTVTCRAENPNVTGLFLETTWKLNVVYPPIVTLRLGSTLSAEDIKDGEDVYFECHVQANPQWRKLYWLHDGVILTHNASARVIRSNQSLVLQRVTRSSSGNYSCSAVNAEGETVSNQLSLRVKYVPVCATDKVIIIGAFRGENLNIVCEVESDPPPRSFRWKFNNSGETLDVGRERHQRNGSMRSILQYTPVTDQDYGTLSCWGQNEVGVQQNPCLFQIVLAGLPSPVRNCTITNQTTHSVEIQCIPGYDGGLPQVFVLELVSTRTGKLRYNITNTDEPIFIIESLENLISFDSLNDHSLKVIVFAVNQKGRSPGVILKDFPFGNELENRSVASFDTSFHLSPIVFGTLLTLLVLCCVIVGRMYTAKRSHSNDTLSSSKQSSTLLCKQDPSKKTAKSNLRWQHSDSGVKEQVISGSSGRDGDHAGGLATESYDLGDDERDPDVIPSQYVPGEMENCLATEWNHQDSIFNEKFPKHDNRPKDLLLKPLSSTDFQLIAPTNSNYLQHQHQHDIVPNGDLDINVHAIKSMLMTTRVPESCV
ncbi:nephrin-like [Phlebotomus papatasi]|uniref:nephrin-like n=1 Tax=Phlebotomus papatasi TaxID=29031 RepID=UPI0024843C86|nr:nephrin-like [Phlebotomus papatasi]